VIRDLNNQPEQAIKFMKKALELDHENSESWYIYAELLTKLNRKEEADSAFKKVIELDPVNIDAWIDYSNFLFDNTSKLKALNLVEKSIEINKNNFDLKLRLVAMQISIGLISEAKLNLIEMQGNNPKTFNKLLDIYPELLENKSINEFFALYNDSSQK
jgi:tetratricopeptide (TPR) repeat protein